MDIWGNNRIFAAVESYKTMKDMEARTMSDKRRTREEIIAWWHKARERKEAFQRETDEWWKARQKGLEESESSGYYKIEMT